MYEDITLANAGASSNGGQTKHNTSLKVYMKVYKTTTKDMFENKH